MVLYTFSGQYSNYCRRQGCKRIVLTSLCVKKELGLHGTPTKFRERKEKNVNIKFYYGHRIRKSLFLLFK